MYIPRHFLLVALLFTATPALRPCWARAQSPPPPAAASSPADREAAIAAARAQRDTVLHGLRFQQGDIALGKDLAKLSVPAGFRFLGPDDAETVLVQLWGNPPSDEKTLGLIVPANGSLSDENSWAVVLTYDESGYVKDSDADKINYNDLLREMQKSACESNAERTKAGYPTIELVGWAAPPRYDKATNKLYWARDLKFGDSNEHTLNYNIRLLGRRGVLVLNAVAGLSQLKEIEAVAPLLLAMVDFKPGQRYADFDPKSDKVAAYGIAALIAGGIMAKAGLFKVIWLGVLAFKKFIILGAVALFAFLKQIAFGKKRETPPPTA